MVHIRSFVVVITVGLMLACSRSPAAPTSDGAATLAPLSASAAPAAAMPGPLAAAAPGRQEVLVNILDACDPETFNAVVGPGTCVRAGGVQFDQFITLLTRLGFVGPWHFAPLNTNVQVGQTFVAANKGGEVHTFTEVDEFGGGIVPRLNELTGVPTVAPECAALEEDDFVAPGGTYREEIDHAGTVKVQCCIHPWMRLEAKVSSR